MATILIVDDEFKTRVAIMEVIETEGHVVLPASNAFEAKNQLQAHPEIDAVFTDLGMPLGSGWDLLAHIHVEHPGLPVVVVSAWGNTVDEDQIIAYDIHRVIGKPFTISEIRVVLREVLLPSVNPPGPG